MSDSKGPSPDETPQNFVRDIIHADLAAGRHHHVATRFPPEPNGYLHIGHAKSICLNFGLARDFDGTCNLRFDDTNPETEDMEYVRAIQRDVAWLGFEWDGLFFASDYFERLYECAVTLIRKGKAYVESLPAETMREYRGTITEPGRPTPDRDRSIAENLELFERMKNGEFANGELVLRAKADLESPNMLMRDPVIYRIRHASHYRRGDTWCIYPMYDFTHCLSDAFEGITHSLCTLEFDNNREIYDWVVAETEVPHTPRQYEFARLNLSYTVVSKRKLLELVEQGHVAGWDDPRMPTLSGLRRRGYTPESIRNFCDRVGVTKNFNIIDVALLEWSVRDDLNVKVPRVLAVLNPLRVVIENYPESQTETLAAPYYPHDIPKEGSRQVTFSREILIERDDFMEDPPPGYHRLAPGREVRLRYAYLIRCEKVIKNGAGEIVELRCTYDPETRGGQAPDGRKVKGTVHWVSADRCVAAEVRLYDRLFLEDNPGDGDDFLDHLNPKSLEVLSDCRVEASLAGAAPGDAFQFERLGYFCVDPDVSGDGLVFNRTVTLRDSWAKIAHGQDGEGRDTRMAEKTARKAAAKAAQRERSQSAPEAKALSSAQQRELERYLRLGVAEQDARLLATHDALPAFFEAARSTHDNASEVAKWITNELLRELKERDAAELPFGGRELGELVAMIDRGTITGTIAKDVFAEMVRDGERPGRIVERLGLVQMDDAAQLEPVVAEVLAAHPDQVADYRSGKTALLGFFVGQVMKSTRGRANPKRVQELLRSHLGEG